MSLLSELGFNYSSEMFSGAMYIHEGKAGYIDSVSDEGTVYFRAVRARGVPGDHVAIDHRVFESWDSFSYPTLGYRQDTETNYLAYVTRTPSVRRGFHFGEAQMDVAAACTSLESNLGTLSLAHPGIGSRHYSSLFEYKVPLIMQPVYTPFREGLTKLLSGEIPYFCTSAEYAVCPSGTTPGFDILYRRRMAGTISVDGNIELLSNTPATRQLWAQEIERG